MELVHSLSPEKPARADRAPVLMGLRDAESLFRPLVGAVCEIAAFAYLDKKRRMVGMRHIRSDSEDMLDLPIREIVTDILSFSADAVLMAHNHPSGDPTPSVADRHATRMLTTTLGPLGVRLVDHLVLARDGVSSFRTLGLL